VRVFLAVVAVLLRGLALWTQAPCRLPAISDTAQAGPGGPFAAGECPGTRPEPEWPGGDPLRTTPCLAADISSAPQDAGRDGVKHFA
jgi:hypothetical protein